MTQIIKNKPKKDWRLLEYVVPITEAIQDEKNDFRIKGIAINSTTTRNGHKFVAEELKKSASSLKNKPLLKNHDNNVESIVGRVTSNVKFDSLAENITFEAKVMDPLMREMISDGRITSVSVGATVQDMVEAEGEDALIAKGIEFLELSLVAVPADPNASFAARLSENFKLKQDCDDELIVVEEVTTHSKKQLDEVQDVKEEKEEIEKMAEENVKTEEVKQESVKEEVVDTSKIDEAIKKTEKLIALKAQLKEMDEAEPVKEAEAEPEAEPAAEPAVDETEGEVSDDEEEEVAEEDYKIEKSNNGYGIYKESYDNPKYSRLSRL